MSTSVADMQLFFMGLHDKDHTFSCKNMDQLSSLWAAFTKCKRNIRDGFRLDRLENLSWRLWYREAMKRKRLETEPSTTADLVLPPPSSASIEKQDTNTNTNNNNPAKQLVRTRSLPSISCQAQHIMDSCQTTTTTILPNEEEKMTLAHDHPTNITPKRSKFYIDQDDDADSDMDSFYDDQDDLDSFDIMDDDDDDSSYSTDSASSSFDGQQHHLPAAKPISLLTHLLQKESSHPSTNAAATASTVADTGGLRRSHCYGRLDQWFSSALAS